MEFIEVTTRPLKDSKPLVLVIGKFDGIHIGHSELLIKAKEYANDAALAVMSFSAHPNWVLRQDVEFEKFLTPTQEKIKLLNNYGVERYYQIEFTKEFAKISAKEFVLDHLSRLNIKRVVIGEGFHFGKGREADTQGLIELCKMINVPVTVIPLVKENGRKMSSTVIRTLVQQGKMEAVQSLLGRPYKITGTVIHGEALGRTLGFPTINLGGIEQYVLPKPGIYIGSVEIDNGPHGKEHYYTLISAGYRPTVNGETYLVEAYLLDFSGDLYDKKVSVSFLRFLREEIKFSDLELLKKQMNLDELEAKTILGML